MDPAKDTATNAYFERDGELFVPTRNSAGPWAPNSITGRPVLGLCAHVFEQALPDPSWLPARLSVDMMRMAMLEPIEVVIEVRKTGRTAMVVDIELIQSGRPVSLARGLATRAETRPDSAVWTRSQSLGEVPTEFLPAHPDYPMSLTGGRRLESGISYGNGPKGWLSPADGPPAAWVWERGDLIAGEVTSVYERLGLVADISNSVINVGRDGLKFINPDITLYVSRMPSGDYLGLEALEHLHTGGTSVGSAVVHDVQGPMGVVSMTSTHQPHMPTIVFDDPTGPAASQA